MILAVILEHGALAARAADARSDEILLPVRVILVSLLVACSPLLIAGRWPRFTGWLTVGCLAALAVIGVAGALPAAVSCGCDATGGSAFLRVAAAHLLVIAALVGFARPGASEARWVDRPG
ncbi:MAG: hypothetical protein CMJ18_27095 [Phycisphaeraceae bacterium]|nr:hypothetical protein [Phycisphaeraceae bacterium]